MEAYFRQLVSSQKKGPIAGLARGGLAAASIPYRIAVAARNRLYDCGVLATTLVDSPVISIGNITLGGTGKTPFVEYVCRRLIDRGKRVAILSRGYRSTQGGNDEFRLLAERLPGVPHLQGTDRVALARDAIAKLHAEVLVLDDGFQHRRLARSLDIVLVDCTEPFGYGYLFPRGLLREPIANLARADLVVMSRSNHCSDSDRDRIRRQIVDRIGGKPIVSTEHRATSLRAANGDVIPVRSIAGRSAIAFCGIGNPHAFWMTLNKLGAKLVGQLAFPDHHPFSTPDLLDLDTWVDAVQPDFVLCTEKDLVKLSRQAIGDRPLYALQIEVSIRDGERELERALDGLAAARQTKQAA